MDITQHLTVDDIRNVLEQLENEEDDVLSANVVVLPPDNVDYITDEENINDDEIADPQVTEVAGSLELHIEKDEVRSFTNNKIIETDPGAVSSDCLDNNLVRKSLINSHDKRPKSIPKISKTKRKENKIEKRKWTKSEPEYEMFDKGDHFKTCAEQLKSMFDGEFPVAIFESFFSPEVMNDILSQTMIYATTCKNDQTFSINLDELKIFFGILLFSGYHTLPQVSHYWSSADDLGVPLISNAMSRNRFNQIKAYIHFNDNADINDETKLDKAFKVRPIIDSIAQSFSRFGVFDEKIAVDEMVVKYFGRNKLKQFIKGKPIRFGYKLWALCGVSGFCYNFDLYCGREINPGDETLPLGTRVVQNLLTVVEDPLSYEVYFDNFFTNLDLLRELYELGFRASGTIRADRTQKCPLVDPKVMKKQERGTYDFCSDTNTNILLGRWNDNSVVTVATNFDTVEPLTTAQRYNKEQKRKCPVSLPRLIKNYSTSMGGVDLHDWLVSKYGINIKGKKWYWPIFIRLLDMCVVNAWTIYKLVNEKYMSLLDFRREITVAYIKTASIRQTIGRPVSRSQIAQPCRDMRYDKKDHFLFSRLKQRRCQGKGCKSKPLTYCKKCEITLCKKCFGPYHLQ